ncbi:hypothetical protein FHS95_003584 [Sphingomonas naasensis]|uniref:L,D-transpeptidase family protein n=1 Tax=Sphingomonas naasensis TaxID=1344951 RepID=UPI001F0F511C|nr:L,D-transpeptidase family protein [Sphingomonas naasensis]NIJ21873.1 hypothetical protein [Sphingomonas naasensis]
MLSLRPACALALAVAALLAGDAGGAAVSASAQNPLLVVVDVRSQRLVAYRDGVAVAASPVSTGKPGYGTPAGVFTILQKKSFHRSNQYSNAPMPFMQRLTWQGVALHAGALPGYPASHGCIRLPHDFARQLFAETRTGMTVLVTGGGQTTRGRPVAGPAWWRPGLASRGPVTIVVSGVDRRMTVLREGVQIGSAPVAFDGTIERAQAWVWRDDRGWTRVALPGETPATEVRAALPTAGTTSIDPFQRALGGALGPGATMLVVPDSLAAGIGAMPVPAQLFGDEELIEEWLADDMVRGGR